MGKFTKCGWGLGPHLVVHSDLGLCIFVSFRWAFRLSLIINCTQPCDWDRPLSSFKDQSCVLISNFQNPIIMMLKHFQSGRWVMLITSSPKLPFSPKPTSSKSAADSRYFRTCSASADALHLLRPRRALSICWAARRRAVRYDDDGEDEEEEEYGHHKEIAVLELYSQSVRGEALIVHAVVDDQDVQVLIFKVCF